MFAEALSKIYHDPKDPGFWVVLSGTWDAPNNFMP